MANDLTIPQPPANALCLPASVERSARWMGEVTWPGQRTRKYLPDGLSLTSQQRAECEAQQRVVTAALDATSGDARAANKARAVILSKLIMASPGAALSEHVAQAKGEAYQMALDDKPAWAIQEAVRRWYRREWGDEVAYTFAPGPADLRALTDRVLAPYVRTQVQLDELLTATSLDEAMDSKAPPRNALTPNLRSMP